ncbi:ATP-binding cassette domain-containing protein [Caulobacter sp. SLTY]|uniref:ABC transporter ATP-binding protein n=1 Tax=Caulobacter sp. SLTY TaxID=2683262 RepID=UPI0014132583|nr:ABC transporter ATP-binding protein [Caulobacter sp. SLTY]NBB15307.1 ATP-binding cassette domain-containing protein [Caulobacter sp. SLTY]
MTHAAPLPHSIASPTGDLAVATEGLVKRYGKDTALGGINLAAPEGGVYLLAGENGAGKSTLLRILMNLVRPDGGSTRVFGLDPQRQGPQVRAEVGYIPETHQPAYRWMTVGRLLDHHAAYYPAWDQPHADRLCRQLSLRPDAKLGSLSKGQARRAQLVCALARRPRLLLLDEPTDGLDPVARDEVLGLLSDHLADTGGTILISTHLIYEVDRLADHIGVLRGGALLAQLPREDLHRRLKLYRADGPEGWVGPANLQGVIKRAALGREIRWTVWGEEAEVATRIADSGGVVRDVASLTLDDAVVALMRAKD